VVGRLNDLWKFDGTNWTWISGLKERNKHGIHETKGVPDPNNVPGSREEAASWIDSENNLYLFGGYGKNAIGTKGIFLFIYCFIVLGELNDLWKFDGTNWTWISGSKDIDTGG